MKTQILLGIVVVLGALSPRPATAVTPTADEMKEARQWAAASFEGVGKKSESFFSFTCGGRTSVESRSGKHLMRPGTGGEFLLMSCHF